MSIMQISSAEQELAELGERFAHWRATRASNQERIPQALWDVAIRVSTRLPNSHTAKTLRLSPGELKRRRLAQQAGTATEVVEAGPDFVELTPVRPGSAALNGAGAEVELERPDGARLRIHYYREPQPPLVDLVRAFLERP
jgi:hypothetical protein